jgi:hypothetical protein
MKIPEELSIFMGLTSAVRAGIAAIDCRLSAGGGFDACVN